jgi:hypothetical protein
MPWFCLKDVVVDGRVLVRSGETLPDDHPLPKKYRNNFRADGRTFMDERNQRRRGQTYDRQQSGKQRYGELGPRITTRIETEDDS